MKKFQRKRLAQAVAASLAIGGASLASANFVEITGNNPFSAITSTGDRPSLVMMDLDDDGDLDTVLFHRNQNDNFPYSGYGGISVWENTGSASEAAFTQVSDSEYGGYGTGDNITVNPFAGDYDNYYGHPVSAADVDGDGDLDFFGGQSNSGSSKQLAFGRVNTDPYGIVTGVAMFDRYDGGYIGYGDAANPFYGTDLAPTASAYGMSSAFAAGDLDNDTDVDLFVVDAGTLRQYSNDGDAYGVFQFNEVTDGPFPLGLTSPYYGAPIALHDVDDDGDLDLVMGTVEAAPLRVFVNEGNASAADFVELENTSGSIDVTSRGWASPSFADINGDGRSDLIVVELIPPMLMGEESATRLVPMPDDEQEIRVFVNKEKSDSSSDFLGSLGGASLLAGILLLFRRRK